MAIEGGRGESEDWRRVADGVIYFVPAVVLRQKFRPQEHMISNNKASFGDSSEARYKKEAQCTETKQTSQPKQTSHRRIINA